MMGASSACKQRLLCMGRMHGVHSQQVLSPSKALGVQVSPAAQHTVETSA